MNAIPANISVMHAQLPAHYEAAKSALARCESVDECKEWADKAAALASYAKQANDETLEKQCLRIRARAVRRMGELLKQFDGRPSNATKQTDAADSLISQRKAAERAGISERQQVTAVRVANVPREEFEAPVESDNPPSITELAMRGVKPNPRPVIDLKGRDPGAYNRSLHFVAMIEEYAKELRSQDFNVILPGLVADEIADIRKFIAEIDGLHDRIVTRI